MNLSTIISVVQIAVAIIVIILVLLQERSSGSSGVFGGGNEGGMYQTRRGIEKILFIATVVCLALFIATSVAHLVI